MGVCKCGFYNVYVCVCVCVCVSVCVCVVCVVLKCVGVLVLCNMYTTTRRLP